MTEFDFWDESDTVWLCPECGGESASKDWPETYVGCDLCGDHSARKCPSCGDVFDYVWDEENFALVQKHYGEVA
jgi:ribosomal protein S27E